MSNLSVIASDEIIEKRRALCAICPKRVETWAIMCEECGCVISIKTALKFTKCPLNKW